MKRKLRFGMIGGGRGAFIGAVHRIAAAMDGQAELVAGAFSSDAQRSADSGADLLLPPGRVYANYLTMAAAEKDRPSAERMDFVVIVTPNYQHFAPARIFLAAGFNVICDKPVTLDLPEALTLQKLVAESGKVFVLTHNYTGNVMVKQARELVRAGKLGKVRKVVVEYPQGWLRTALEESGQKQALWRADPAQNGAAGCIGDIGTHAWNLVHYITGLEIESLCADLTSFVRGRKLDDDASVLLRFSSGARGLLFASQIAVGEENNLTIRIYGELAGLEWKQEQSNDLLVRYPDRPSELWRRGNGYVSPGLQRFTRLPAGHPEGFLEAFANIYQEAFRAIRAEVSGEPLPDDLDFPNIDDGVSGMQFIGAVVESSRRDAAWVKFPAG